MCISVRMFCLLFNKEPYAKLFNKNKIHFFSCNCKVWMRHTLQAWLKHSPRAIHLLPSQFCPFHFGLLISGILPQQKNAALRPWNHTVHSSVKTRVLMLISIKPQQNGPPYYYSELVLCLICIIPVTREIAVVIGLSLVQLN